MESDRHKTKQTNRPTRGHTIPPTSPAAADRLVLFLKIKIRDKGLQNHIVSAFVGKHKKVYYGFFLQELLIFIIIINN